MERNLATCRRPTGPDQAWLPFPGGPAGPFIVLATDRLAERNAAVYALDRDGAAVEVRFARFASQARAEKALRRWRRVRKLNDGRWAYCVAIAG